MKKDAICNDLEIRVIVDDKGRTWFIPGGQKDPDDYNTMVRDGFMVRIDEKDALEAAKVLFGRDLGTGGWMFPYTEHPRTICFIMTMRLCLEEQGKPDPFPEAPRYREVQ